MKIPEPSYGPLYHRHNHDPGITDCPNGDLLAIWYTTVSERGRELALAASRLRHGEDEWQPASPLWDAPDRNDHCPALWYDGDKTIYHINSISVAATWGPLAVWARSSTDSGATWSKARFIIPEYQGRNQVIESVFRTNEGYLVIPCDAVPGGSGGTALHISRDGGKTWRDPGGTVAGIHAGVAQLASGRLVAFGRGDSIAEGSMLCFFPGLENQGNGRRRMPMSISDDMGRTWTYRASPFPPIGGGQRLVLLRLKEGPLFLVSFVPRNDPVMVTDTSGARRPVHGLFAALSYDGGETWPKVRLVSDDGPPRETMATDRSKFTLSRSSAEPRGYLSVCQAGNGLIHLISSWNHYEFNLSWLEALPPANP